jgi:predicted SnoaL-like aldol condensation-catalyzing enzyme
MTKKEKAAAYHGAVSRYDESSVIAMVDENYIQHNPFMPTGRAAFVSLLPKLKAHGSKIENVRMLQDGSYIIMHHVWKNATPFGKDEMAAFHIIRFDQAGLIAEHWNVMTEMTPANPSGRSLVDGETEIQDLDQTGRNKTQVVELFSRWIGENQNEMKDILPVYFKVNFHQHDPTIADGIAGLTAALRNGKFAIEYTRQNKVFAEGNFVLSISEGLRSGNPVACYDLFRLEDGLIAEHWNITQDIPKENLANDNTMFNF